jgi:hypothetical protein
VFFYFYSLTTKKPKEWTFFFGATIQLCLVVMPACDPTAATQSRSLRGPTRWFALPARQSRILGRIQRSKKETEINHVPAKEGNIIQSRKERNQSHQEGKKSIASTPLLFGYQKDGINTSLVAHGVMETIVHPAILSTATPRRLSLPARRDVA